MNNNLSMTIKNYFLISKLLFVALCLNVSYAFAQCPSGSITLSSQSQVDQFIIDYPNCTSLERLDITLGADIINVNGLINIETIVDQLNITSNPLLTNLSGFNNLKSVGSNFWISGNEKLSEINAFTNLMTVGTIYIGFNPSLNEIAGFQGLTILPNLLIEDNNELQYINIYPELSEINGTVSIKNNPKLTDIYNLGYVGKINSSMTIQNNASLINLNGFSSLTFIKDINIENNSALKNLNSLSGVRSIGGSLQLNNNVLLNNISSLKNIDASSISANGLIITNNPLLSICDLPNFCMYLQGTGLRSISGNATGCDSEQVVINACAVDMDGEYCTNAISINGLFNQPFDEPQTSGSYSNEGYYTVNDPTFGHDCVPENGTIWFKFIGDGHKYEIRSIDCGIEWSDPSAALYAGDCSGLTSVECHADIWLGDENPDANFRFILDSELGKEYFIMVDVRSLNNNFGEFCLKVTKLAPECLVNIKDENFKIYLIENFDINTNGDSEIQCEEAEAYIGSIDCSALSIADMTGLESFVNITSLLCNDNNLSQLDVSKNTQLTQLNCSNNALTSLNLSVHTELKELYCFGNQLTNLNIVNNKSLAILACNDNSLFNLDISENPSLYQVWCYNNKLTSLNLANGINEDFLGVEAFNNPDLTCIQVDNPVFSNDNWTTESFKFDEQHVFSENCTPCLGLDFAANFLVSTAACLGDSVHLIDYTYAIDSLANEMDLKFFWDFGNGDNSNERDPIYKYPQSGDYTISLSVSNSECEDVVIKKVISILECRRGGSNVNKLATLYPSPNTGSFKIDIKLPEIGPVNINIYNAAGKNIQQHYMDGKQNISDDIIIENPGLYFIEIRHNYGLEYLKTMVIK